MSKDKFTFVDGIEYRLFRPSIFKLYDNCYSDYERPDYFKRIVHKVRMSLQLFMSGYRVYYMYIHGKAVGHLVVSNGGFRLPESDKDDIVIGPIWICPNKRGCGLGTKGTYAVLKHLETHYKYAYEFIAEDNIASICSVKKNGFELLGHGIERGIFKKITLSESGEWLLYRKANLNR